jgi:hypothetical protein
MLEQVQCPDTQNYHWPRKSVLKGLEDGLIDFLSAGGLFGTSVVTAYKLNNRELGERVRAECIRGFTPVEA